MEGEVAEVPPKKVITSVSGMFDQEVAVVKPKNSNTSVPGTMKREVVVVQPKHSVTSISGTMDQEVAVVQPKHSVTSISGTMDQEVAVVQPKHSVTSISGTMDREVAVAQPKHSVTSISGTMDREVAVAQPKHSVTSISEIMDREVAVAQPKHSVTSISGTMDQKMAVVQSKHSNTSVPGTMHREVAVVKPKLSVTSIPETMNREVVKPKSGLTSLSSDVEPTPTASIPVSMVVHGGTGVLHGNMTSLTVNQYIGMVPERGRGAWDSDMVRELVADAVKISADANAQLFHPSGPVSKPAHSGLHKKLNKATRTRGCWILLAVLIIASSVVLVSTSLYIKFSPATPSETRQPHTVQPHTIKPFHLPTPSTVTEVEIASLQPENDSDAPRILQRSFWLARPSRGVMTRSVLPLREVIVCDTETDACYTQDDCVDVVRNHQRYDMDTEKLQDIAYNFMVGGEGNVYVGRGWDLQGAHTKHHNVASLGVALIGTFSEVPPSEAQLVALGRLVNTGVENHKVAQNYTILTHCQLRTDSYPGKALAHQLSAWPHFDSSQSTSRCT